MKQETPELEKKKIEDEDRKTALITLGIIGVIILGYISLPIVIFNTLLVYSILIAGFIAAVHTIIKYVTNAIHGDPLDKPLNWRKKHNE